MKDVSDPDEKYDVEDEDAAVGDVSVDGIRQETERFPHRAHKAVALLIRGILRSLTAAVSAVKNNAAQQVDWKEEDGGEAVEEDVPDVTDLPLDDVARSLGLEPIFSQYLLTEVVSYEPLLARPHGGLYPGVLGVVLHLVLVVVVLVHQYRLRLANFLTTVQKVHFKSS